MRAEITFLLLLLDISLSLSLSLSLSARHEETRNRSRRSFQSLCGGGLDDSNGGASGRAGIIISGRMNRWKAENFSQSFAAAEVPPSTRLQSLSLPMSAHGFHASLSEFRQRLDVERKDPILTARKVQKADREKLRRDRLNELFLELENKLDTDKAKNDKATILTETIQILKDLTAEVNRLKAEFGTLSEESQELTLEKNELKEEKASLKSDLENLNTQYQQRLSVVFPWARVESYSSVVMTGPPYSYTVPVAVPPGSLPLPPFPFFGNQSSGPVANHGSAFVPFITATTRPNKQTVAPYGSPAIGSSKQHTEVATELQLKMPGSSPSQQDLSSGVTKSVELPRKEQIAADGSSSSEYSSTQVQDSSCNSVGNVLKPNNAQ